MRTKFNKLISSEERKRKRKENRHQHFVFFRKGWELFKDEGISPNADAIKVILKRSTSIDNLAS